MDWTQAKHELGYAAMDARHQEFTGLHQKLMESGREDFATHFEALYEETKEHFAEEESWMESIGHSAIAEHKAEHEKVLGELYQFLQKSKAGNTLMAKAYAKERLPEWFDLHLSTMDSALAAAMKEQGS